MQPKHLKNLLTVFSCQNHNSLMAIMMRRSLHLTPSLSLVALVTGYIAYHGVVGCVAPVDFA